MIDGQETDLEIIDHPASEMAVSIFQKNFQTIFQIKNKNSIFTMNNHVIINNNITFMKIKLN